MAKSRLFFIAIAPAPAHFDGLSAQRSSRVAARDRGYRYRVIVRLRAAARVAVIAYRPEKKLVAADATARAAIANYDACKRRLHDLKTLLFDLNGGVVVK